ncbi:MAG: acyl-CoA dehydrogenase [Rhodobacteraceae bacterium]|nr:acyl-CoA dehydrogenase [Paracoccaceae bacterium]
MTYRPPVDEFRFHFAHGADMAALSATDRFAQATPDVDNGVVRTPPGFADGWRALAEGGWLGLSAQPRSGGLGMPMLLTTAVNEMMAGACLSLSLAPLMTQGQVEALEHHADPALQALYLPRLVSGDWMATMNLTEPQAGSDVGALTTRAEPAPDGSWRITGQKIYITWGDADFAANTCHLVLARRPGAPAGSRGISLFLVPKRLPDAAGNPGPPNALRVLGVEHKLGLHGAPTCTMAYDGATGWLVGAPDGGMAAMFTMMNNARLGVGVQGVGIAEAACQRAVAFARDRRQGRVPDRPGATGAIADHADVRRMLVEMRAETAAARAIALSCAAATDMAAATGDPAWAARAAFLTPIAKAWGTDTGIRVADTGLQVHGGMGYIEETGAAQLWRDVRVTAIYEGTNGIQAMDLVGRKLADGGTAAMALIDDVQAGAERARARVPDLAGPLWQAAEALREATDRMLDQGTDDRNAGAAPYLAAFARVLGAHHLVTAALADPVPGPRQALAAAHVGRILPRHTADLAAARDGADGLYALPPEVLG